MRKPIKINRIIGNESAVNILYIHMYIRKTSDNSWKQIPQKSLFEPLNIERQEHQGDQDRYRG